MIKWYDMMDSVYTLVSLVGLDPDTTDIRSINIANDRLTVWYRDEEGKMRSAYEKYDLE